MENYEQKYKESLERCKSWMKGEHPECFSEAQKAAEFIFPELKESEDEQHRKWILEYLYDGLRKSDEQFKGQFKAAIAWLEKQCEQKPAGKVEPKFEVGDWITNGEYTWKVADIKPLDYILQSPNEDVVNDIISYVDECFRLWTIQDAKEGDVLQLGKVTAIFKKYIGNEHCICYCSYCKAGGFEIPIANGEDNNYGCYNATPANKKQRGILFQKMYEAGYEWDADKKELKKIEQKPIPKFKIGEIIHKIGENTVFPRTIEKIEDGDYVCNNSHAFVNIKFQDDYELVEQATTWSEEDEKIRKAQLNYWRSVGGKEWYGVPVQETIAWLEKQAVQKSWSEG